MGRSQWVVKHASGWAQKGEGNQRATKVFDRQSDAIDAARQTAIRQKSELVIQGDDGQIRERNSYGNDPRRSKG